MKDLSYALMLIKANMLDEKRLKCVDAKRLIGRSAGE